MKELRHVIEDFCSEHELPGEATGALLQAFDTLTAEPSAVGVFDELAATYKEHTEVCFSKRLAPVSAAAEKVGVSPYTAQALLFISQTEALWVKYQQRGLSRQVWHDSLDDIRRKLFECYRCHGIWGSCVGGWFTGFFHLGLFKLGRLEFEKTHYKGPDVQTCGVTVHTEDVAINVHIPSGEPFSHDAVLDSYRQAAAFFREELFPDSPVIFTCESWLLSPIHGEKLPPESHIRQFIDDYTLTRQFDTPENNDLWRIFYDKASLPPQQLPRDTLLRRIYADWLTAGGCMNECVGVFVWKE